jgi:hypothetical protein
VPRAPVALVALAISAGAVLVAASAVAEEPAASARPDSSDGRIEGDLGVVLGVGVTVAPRGLRAAVDARLRFVETAGVFVTYEDGTLTGSVAQPARVLAAGVELRPLFVGRWGNDLEWGRPRLDLLLDSLGLELGASFSQRGGQRQRFDSTAGLQAGLGIEVPILARASGPWIGLHGGVRWGPRALAGEPIVDPNDRSLFLSITVAYHQIFRAHAIDVGDELHR